ncbi:hypothetical protein HN51_014032 [Arachis hypogaea]
MCIAVIVNEEKDLSVPEFFRYYIACHFPPSASGLQSRYILCRLLSSTTLSTSMPLLCPPCSRVILPAFEPPSGTLFAPWLGYYFELQKSQVWSHPQL